jgi:hypothetical protein
LHAARRRATIAHHEGEDHAMSLSRRRQFVVPGAFRKNVQGVLQFGATLLWNIQV